MNLDEARKWILGWDKPPAAGRSLPAPLCSVPQNCIAFYKGDRVDDWILELAVEMATLGYITEAGRKLYLIPNKLYEQARRDQQTKADDYARMRRKTEPGFKSGPASPSVKKSDCIPLTSFLPKKGDRSRARLRPNRVSSPPVSRVPEGACGNACTKHPVLHNGNAECHYCFELMTRKRRGAMYCGNACKQAAYRLRVVG